ncbi:MAG: glycosyltransferase, partial [Ruminococcus sp.]|nr:glycosyltransferase [Ruminococcus sp.]
TAEGFYKILNKMGAKVIFNHADFRLMSRRALEAFSEYKETNIFLRGMVPLIGYKSDIVTYERFERLAGESKYPLKKMLALAWEGITSMSVQPIRMITWLGGIVFAISIIMIIYSVISFCVGAAMPGWSSILCSIWAIGGLQILAIGIIGEYIGKIYLETKRRPRFIVETFLED